MALRYPTRMLHRITDVSPELLAQMKVRAVLLDVDDTLSAHGSQIPYPGSVEWAQELVDRGFQLIILSNNTKDRVAPFAKQYGLPFLTFAAKPLPVGYLRAARRLGVKPRECVIVGDQVFTDVLGANLCGMQSILLDPITLQDSFSFRVRRKWEKPVRRKMTEKERRSQDNE